MSRGYYALNIELPDVFPGIYRNFINLKGGTGNKKDPTELEKRLPENWKRTGSASGSSFGYTSVSYEFPEHTDGLSEIEILKITKDLIRLGAKSWEFDSVC